MEDKELIRRLVNIQGLSQREVFRKFGWSRDSIADAIKNPEPNSYTLQSPRPRPVTDPIVPLVKQWLEEDKSKPRKQRHTKTRIFERLRDEYDFKGSRRAISNLINSIELISPEVFCPIDHPPGAEFQIDWGQAMAIVGGVETHIYIFCARSAYSKATFVKAYQIQLGETCSPVNEMQLIVVAIPEQAHQSDSGAMMKVLIDLQKNDLLPTEIVADTAYGGDDNFCLCKR